MDNKLAVEPVSFDVVALLRSGDDLRSELSNSALEDDLRCIRQNLGGGEPVEHGLNGPVLEEVTGTIPL